MFEWIKKHKIIVIISSIILIFGIPLIIHVLFKIHAGIPFLEAEWSAGEILGYYGSILSFIGTVVLGVLALYQNRLIKEESDKRALILEQREHERNMPKFTVESKGSNGNCAHLHFVMSNISDNLSTEIKLSNIHIISPDGKIHWQSKRDYSFMSISANGVAEIKLDNPSLQHDGYVFSIKMQCRDKYNDVHNYSIDGTYYSKEFYPKLSITEII